MFTTPKSPGFSSHRFCASVRPRSLPSQSSHASQAVITTTAGCCFWPRLPEAAEARGGQSALLGPVPSSIRKNSENPRILGKQSAKSHSQSSSPSVKLCSRKLLPGCVCVTWEQGLGLPRMQKAVSGHHSHPTEPRMPSLRREWSPAFLSQDAQAAVPGRELWVSCGQGGRGKGVGSLWGYHVLRLCQRRGLVGLCVLPSVVIWGPLLLRAHLHDGLLGLIFSAKRGQLVQPRELGRGFPRAAGCSSGH